MERKKQQRAQQRAWLEQQIKERKQADLDRKNADHVLLSSLQARDRQLCEIDQIQRSNNQKKLEVITNFNIKLATEKNIEKKLEKQRVAEDNLAEIYNMLGSDMLMENPNCADSPLGGNKKIAYMYRGMNEEERAAFRRDQKAQVEKALVRLCGIRLGFRINYLFSGEEDCRLCQRKGMGTTAD